MVVLGIFAVVTALIISYPALAYLGAKLIL
jgi:hypothetical protein